MALKKINQDRQRLADIVYQQLLDAILNGEIVADQKLVQEKLAEELQISRTPVREALLRLEQEGVLRSSSRGGFSIHVMSNEDVRQIYQARVAIEGQAARILAIRNDPGDLKDLRDTIATEEAADAQTMSDFFQANRKIHRRIVELCGNRYLLEMFDSIWNRSIAMRMFAVIGKPELEATLESHGDLAEGIESGDPAKAMDAVNRHIEDGLDLQLEALGKVD